MSIKILKKAVTLIGNIGNSFRFNKKDENWEMVNPTTKLKKNDLVYPARPFPLVDKATNEVYGWGYEMSFYPDDDCELPFKNLVGPMKIVVFDPASQHILGKRSHPETGELIDVRQLTRGMKIKLTGSYYQKKWVHSDHGDMVDHCLQIKSASGIVILPRFQRLSPFDLPKIIAGKLKAAKA